MGHIGAAGWVMGDGWRGKLQITGKPNKQTHFEGMVLSGWCDYTLKYHKTQRWHCTMANAQQTHT